MEYIALHGGSFSGCHFSQPQTAALEQGQCTVADQPVVLSLPSRSGAAPIDLEGVAADVKLVGGLQFNGRIVSNHNTDRLSDALKGAGVWLRHRALRRYFLACW
jgi:hypothetical protein